MILGELEDEQAAWQASHSADRVVGEPTGEQKAWLTWYHEAEEAFAVAREREDDVRKSGAMWFGDGQELLEAAEMTQRTYWGWVTRLTALNAFMDWHATHPVTPKKFTFP